MMKKIMALLAAAVMLVSIPLGALAETQVVYSGGSEMNNDGVTISKTLSQVTSGGKLLENFFDVTLTVEIEEEELRKQAQFSTEIVMVLDISNTMTAKVEGETTRMDLVKDGMSSFVSNIADKHPGKVDLSLVVFNTDANTLINKQTVPGKDKAGYAQLQAKIDSITPSDDGKGGGSNYADSYKRFTNIEGGLQMAYNLLKDHGAEQQYVILMTDGFPTTYNVTPGDQNKGKIEGYNPYTTVSRTIRKYSDNYSLDSANSATASRTFAPSSYNDAYYGYRGYFADAPFRQLTPYGTSYSDWGAYYAQRLAMHMKGYYKDKYANLNTGAANAAEYVIGKPDPNNTNRINIFTMGVSLGAQTIDEYQERDVNIVDAMKSADLSSKTYPPLEEPNLSTASNHIIGEGSTGSSAANNDKNYENWLGYVIGGGQGFTQANNGQQKKAYYSLNRSTDVSTVYDSILQTIEEINYHRIIETMFTSDPMGANIDVVGLYSKTGELAGMTLNGQAVPGGEDDASITYEGNAPKLSWSLGKSGYIEVTEANQTTRTYELKYRVRLENELEGFAEAGTAANEAIYPTNGVATLSYRVDDTGEVSDTHTMEFPLPSVKGYLGEFGLTKLDSKTRNPIANVKFTLRHNWNCPVCIEGMDQGSSGAAAQTGGISQHAEYVTVYIGDFIQYTDANGSVSFEKIPSGHFYTLYETMPDGYGQATEAHQWPVVVDFDKVSFDGKAYDYADKPVLTNDPQINMTHLQFKGSKSLLNTDGFKDDQFRFELKLEALTEYGDISFEDTRGDPPGENEDRVLTAYASAQASSESAGETGEIFFPLIHVYYPGSYSLTISEVKGTDGRVDYTGDHYDIYFTVDDYTNAQNQSVLHVTNYKVYANDALVLTEDAPDSDAHAAINDLLKFENVHKVTEFALTKLDEDTNRPIEGVEFLLEHVCASCPYTIDSRKTLSDDLGMVSFTYVPVGHDYRLTETKPVGYEGLAHSIGVKIANDGSITYTDENGKLEIVGNQTVLFNTPKYYEDAIAFGGLKNYNNSTEFEEGRFSFELYELKDGVADWRTAAEEDWTLKDTTFNGEHATLAHEFRFDDIMIDDIGVYTYRIREQEGKAGDIAYDPSVYTIVATVEQGELYHDHDHFNFKITYQLYKDDVPVALNTNDSMIRVAMYTQFNNYDIPPVTGDDTQPALLAGAMLLSVAGAVLMIRRRHVR